jgi:hypothetical protein
MVTREYGDAFPLGTAAPLGFAAMVFRERRPSRHRAVDARPGDDSQPEDELESFLAAISPEADCSASELTGRFGSAQVFQVRLPALRIEQLRRLAQAKGLPPTSLVVDWVIERLDQEDPGFGPPPADPASAALPPARPDEPLGSTHPPANPLVAPLSPLEALNPMGEFTSVTPEAALPAGSEPEPKPVTPLRRGSAHAAKSEDDRPRRARHRAPEPVTSLLSRRKF